VIIVIIVIIAIMLGRSVEKLAIGSGMRKPGRHPVVTRALQR